MPVLEERLRQKLSQELPARALQLRAQRHRQRGDELRLADADRGGRQRPDLAGHRPYAEKVQTALAKVSSLRDLQFGQALDYPTVKVDIDRQLAGVLGVTADQIGKSLTEATSSSRFTVPNYWADPTSGIGYQVQVEVPPSQMNSLEQVKNIPIGRSRDVQIVSATSPT